jgi:hypothetical protein
LSTRPLSSEGKFIYTESELSELIARKNKAMNQIDEWVTKFSSEHNGDVPSKTDRDNDPIISAVYKDLKKISSAIKGSTNPDSSPIKSNESGSSPLNSPVASSKHSSLDNIVTPTKSVTNEFNTEENTDSPSSRPVSAKNLKEIEIAQLTIKKMKLTAQIDAWVNKFTVEHDGQGPSKKDRDTDPVVSVVYKELKGNILLYTYLTLDNYISISKNKCFYLSIYLFIGILSILKKNGVATTPVNSRPSSSSDYRPGSNKQIRYIYIYIYKSIVYFILITPIYLSSDLSDADASVSSNNTPPNPVPVSMSTIPDQVSPITSRPVSAKNLREIEVAELTIKKIKLTAQIDEWSKKFTSDYSTFPSKYDRDTDPVISEVYKELKKVSSILKNPQAGITGTPPTSASKSRPNSSTSTKSSNSPLNSPLNSTKSAPVTVKNETITSNEKKIEEKSNSPPNDSTQLPVITTPIKEESKESIDRKKDESVTKEEISSQSTTSAVIVANPPVVTPVPVVAQKEAEVANLSEQKLILTKQVDDWARNFAKGVYLFI